MRIQVRFAELGSIPTLASKIFITQDLRRGNTSITLLADGVVPL